MTKEDIIKQIWDTDEDGWGLQIAINLGADISKIKEAMEEYARQEAIGFAEWVAMNNLEGSRYGFWHDSKKMQVASSTEELYNLYLNQRK